jgi:Zn-finger nucleic acid-binding protein
MELTCPKCHGPMRTYERNGVHVDQCTECRGIFLDRGELERLIDAENEWHERPRERSSGQASAGQHAAQGQHGGGYAQTGSAAGLGAVVNEVLKQVGGSKSHGSSHGQGYPKKRKESFLGDLFG